MVYFLWFACSVIVGIWASSWQRSGIGFALLSLLISPLLGSLVLLAFGKGKAINATTGLPVSAAHIKCPHCAEQVLAEAKICRHCHLPINEPTAAP